MLTRDVPCAWGYCTDMCDPVTGKIVTGFGQALCPCDNMAGWKAWYPEGKAKPQARVLPRGRHGSRVQRSTSRHAYERELRRDLGLP